jgi:hypothetical protein
MPNKNIIFLPFQSRHWEMYLPVSIELEKRGINTVFILLDAYHYSIQHPSSNKLSNVNTITLSIKKEHGTTNKLAFFKSVLYDLLPQWKLFLQQNPNGLLVSVDFGSIHRMMIKEAQKYNYKVATLQDGYYVSLPTKYGWSAEKGRKKWIKRLLMHTPLKQYFNAAIGAAADYWGLYGQVTRDRFCREAGFPDDRTVVVGSPRHKIFRDAVSKNRSTLTDKDTLEVLCMPTGFSLYQDQKLYDAQDDALRWLLDACIASEKPLNKTIRLKLKIKNGYDHQREHYEKLLAHPMVEFLDGKTDLVDLFASADLVITTGSTSSLEAAICQVAVVQIAPAYLSRNITMISSLPLAQTKKEALQLIGEALTDGPSFYKQHCKGASDEMADVSLDWNSVESTTDWIINILNK